jgi:hypothetical protein
MKKENTSGQKSVNCLTGYAKQNNVNCLTGYAKQKKKRYAKQKKR